MWHHVVVQGARSLFERRGVCVLDSVWCARTVDTCLHADSDSALAMAMAAGGHDGAVRNRLGGLNDQINHEGRLRLLKGTVVMRYPSLHGSHRGFRHRELLETIDATQCFLPFDMLLPKTAGLHPPAGLDEPPTTRVHAKSRCPSQAPSLLPVFYPPAAS